MQKKILFSLVEKLCRWKPSLCDVRKGADATFSLAAATSVSAVDFPPRANVQAPPVLACSYKSFAAEAANRGLTVLFLSLCKNDDSDLLHQSVETTSVSDLL